MNGFWKVSPWIARTIMVPPTLFQFERIALPCPSGGFRCQSGHHAVSWAGDNHWTRGAGRLFFARCDFSSRLPRITTQTAYRFDFRRHHGRRTAACAGMRDVYGWQPGAKHEICAGMSLDRRACGYRDCYRSWPPLPCAQVNCVPQSIRSHLG
jgi:hypothetical protein